MSRCSITHGLVQTIVENKPGASGMIAADHVARATPDGLTLFLGSNSTMANDVVLFQQSTSTRPGTSPRCRTSANSRAS